MGSGDVEYRLEVRAVQSADCGSRRSGPPLKSRRSWLVTPARLAAVRTRPEPPKVPPPPPKMVLTEPQLVVATTLLSNGGTLSSVCRSAQHAPAGQQPGRDAADGTDAGEPAQHPHESSSLALVGRTVFTGSLAS